MGVCEGGYIGLKKNSILLVLQQNFSDSFSEEGKGRQATKAPLPLDQNIIHFKENNPATFL